MNLPVLCSKRLYGLCADAAEMVAWQRMALQELESRIDCGVVLIKEDLLAEIEDIVQMTATIPLSNYGCHVLTLKQAEQLDICRDLLDNQAKFERSHPPADDEIHEILHETSHEESEILTSFINQEGLIQKFASTDPSNGYIFPLVKLPPPHLKKNMDARFPAVQKLSCEAEKQFNELVSYGIGDHAVYDGKLYQVISFGALKSIFDSGIGLTNTILHHRLAHSVEKIRTVVNTHQGILKQHSSLLLKQDEQLVISTALIDFDINIKILRDGLFRAFDKLHSIGKTLSRHSRQMIRDKMENSFVKMKLSFERIEKGDLNLDYMSIRDQQKLVNIIGKTVKTRLSSEAENMTASGLADRLPIGQEIQFIRIDDSDEENIWIMKHLRK
ncbi:unnamed protein product [Didymodactylos carnosus]|uniref:Uncharacterized protein n=1 Tax=Didymodactylos carnosus TaxID=1234261 RepID=A0A814R370_9BILA|nr:unnamed protein product [Didymodactylos carnosus]CAF3889930.1 unnamed protein product [Didymodactylos carnosus]